MRIALDALGGDFGATPNVLGAIQAAKEFGYNIILVGDEALIKKELAAAGDYPQDKISIIHAPQAIDMAANPARECRNKKDAGILVCARLVKEGKADAMISAGNSGATMVAALFGIGRIDGVSRPAIASPLPTEKGPAVLMDAGANTDCDAVNLLQFALMGSIYSNIAYGVDSPVVGLLSIGEEEGKGNFLIKNTTKFIKRLGLNYFGNIEGRDVHTGMINVIVCDGFVGNIVLKHSEGLAKSIFNMIKNSLKGHPLATLGILLAKPIFKELKHKTDPEDYGGAPLLGVKGPVLICHGKSGQRAIYNSIKAAAKLVENKAVETIAEKIVSYKEIFKKAQEHESK